MKKMTKLFVGLTLVVLLAVPQFAGAMAQTGREYTDSLRKLGFVLDKTKKNNGMIIQAWKGKGVDLGLVLLTIEDEKTGCLIKFSILAPKNGFSEKVKEVLSRGFIGLVLSTSSDFPPEDAMARDVAKLNRFVSDWWRMGKMNIVEEFTLRVFQCQVTRTDNNCAFAMGLPGV